MKEIYFLTRLSELSHVLEILELICVIVLTVFIAGLFVEGALSVRDSEFPGWAKKWVSATIAVLSVALVLDFFIPNRNDILLIYGLGGTIDYVQSNDKAKQLPDKAVEALNRYLDTINEDKCSKEQMEGKPCRR